jgi:hypothetical protein
MTDQPTRTSYLRPLAFGVILALASWAWLAACAGANGDPAPAVVEAGAAPAAVDCTDAGASG